jgi:hypothetical protein
MPLFLAVLEGPTPINAQLGHYPRSGNGGVHGVRDGAGIGAAAQTLTEPKRAGRWHAPIADTA